jgi:AcrR family transcriptional regulator
MCRWCAIPDNEATLFVSEGGGAVEDRRVRRTRTSIVEAFLSLVVERGYERVTIQDILDRADVGRSTFYAHYRDKEALLMSCFDGLRDELTADLDAMTPGLLFHHAYRHRPVYRALCGRPGGTVVQRYLHVLIAGALRAHLQPQLAAAGSSIPAEAMAEFYTSALLGLLIWWVAQDFKGGPDAIAQIYGELAAPGILAAVSLGYPDG